MATEHWEALLSMEPYDCTGHLPMKHALIELAGLELRLGSFKSLSMLARTLCLNKVTSTLGVVTHLILATSLSCRYNLWCPFCQWGNLLNVTQLVSSWTWNGEESLFLATRIYCPRYLKLLSYWGILILSILILDFRKIYMGFILYFI